MSACVTYTGHFENHKQHTADLQLVALLPSHLVLVQFFGSQTQAGWWCVLLGSDPEVVSSQYLLRFGLKMVKPLESCHLSLEVVIKAAAGRKPSSERNF